MDANVAPKNFLSPAEFAAFSGLSLATVHRRLADGTLPKVQLGGKGCRITIPRSCLDASRAAKPTPNHSPVSASTTRVKSGRRPRWQTKT
jgi:hypothetical protein